MNIPGSRTEDNGLIRAMYVMLFTPISSGSLSLFCPLQKYFNFMGMFASNCLSCSFFFFFVSMHINGYFVFSLNSYKTSIHCPHFQIVFYRVLFTAGVQIVGHMPTELNLPGVSRQNF